MDWTKTTVRRGEKHLYFGIGVAYIRELTVYLYASVCSLTRIFKAGSSLNGSHSFRSKVRKFLSITRILTWFWHGNKVSRLWDGTTGLSDAYYKGNIVFQNSQYMIIMITIFTMVSIIFIFVHVLRLLEVRCNVKSTTFEIWINFQQANRITSIVKIINGMRILLGLVIQKHDVTDSSEW